jgi:hypothetical protein
LTLVAIGLGLLIALLVWTRKDPSPALASKGERFGFNASLDVSPLPLLPDWALTSPKVAEATSQLSLDPELPGMAAPTAHSWATREPALTAEADWAMRERWSGWIGVVDTGRLLQTFPPPSDSPEAQTKAIADMQRATEASANVFNCVIVLDISGKTRKGVPLVLYAAETFDLTNDVILRLRR